MKNKTLIIYFFLFILFSGCETIKKGLGMEKDKPNEFLIEKRDPLVLPPDYKILPPDSKNVKKETQENSLKSVLDQSLTKTKNSSDSTTKPSSNLEQEILKQIK
jgi:hypothetical protein